MADSSATIHPVIQDTGAGCPTSSGTLSAMSLESLSAISGMRTCGTRLASVVSLGGNSDRAKFLAAKATWCPGIRAIRLHRGFGEYQRQDPRTATATATATAMIQSKMAGTSTHPTCTEPEGENHEIC